MSQQTLKYFCRLIILFLLMFKGFAGFATYYTSIASGDWNTASTWNPSGIPVDGDNVQINSGHTITVSNDLNWTAGTIAGNGKLICKKNFTYSSSSPINFWDPADLEVDGNFNYQTGAFSIYGSQKLKVLGNFTVNGAFSSSSANSVTIGGKFTATSVNISSGGMDVGGDFIVINGDYVTSKSITIGGKLDVHGNINISGGTTSIISDCTTQTGKIDVNSGGNIQIGGNANFAGPLQISSTCKMSVAGNVTANNAVAINSDGILDINGNLTIASGDFTLDNNALAVIDGDLTKSAYLHLTVQAKLVVGDDFISNGGSTVIDNYSSFYVFDDIQTSSNQAACNASCFPNDNCPTCQIRSGNEWIADSSPGNPYISYSATSWWVNHLANVGENAGSAVTVCPNSSSGFSLSPEDDGNLAANTFEWAVYGGTITGADNTTTVNGHTASVKTITGVDINGKSGITVTWESSSFTDAYVAVRQTSAAGCSDGKWSVFLINLQGSDAPTGDAAQTFCAGATVAGLTATGTSVKWYSSSTGGTALGTSSVLTNGTYYASQTLNGCESTSRLAVAVTVVEAPTTASAGPDQTGASTCGSTSVTLAANTPTVGTGVWSIIQGSGGSFANSSNPATTFTGTAGSSYILRWTISNSPCTASSDDVLITFNENPAASAGGNQTICQGGSATVSGASASNGTILWTHNGSGTLSNEATLAPTYNSVAGDAGKTIILTMTVSNGTCPAAVATYTIAVNPASYGGTVTGGSTICSGNTSGTLILSGYTGTIIKWQSSTNGTNWTDISNTATTYTSAALTQTTHFRAVLQSGACDETFSGSATVTVSQINISDDVPSTICQWTLPQVTAYASGGTEPYTYYWEDTAGGPYFPGNVPSQSGSTIYISTHGVASGTYTNNFKLTVTDGNMCSTVKFYSVTIHPSVNPTWVAHPSTVCAGQNGVVYTAEQIDNTTYSWTVTGGTIASENGTNSIAVNWGSGATGEVNLVATTNMGCSQTLNQTVTINPMLEITLGANPSICPEATTALLPYSAKSSTANRYSIDFDNAANAAGITDITNATLGAAPGNISINLPGTLASGTYNGTLILKNFAVSPVCTNSYPVSIIVAPLNTAILSSASGTDNQTVCISSSITAITYATTGANGIGEPTGLPEGVTATWASNQITISGTPTASGTFNYSIPLTGGCGTVNATGTITVTPEMTAGSPSSTPTLCINTELTPITISTTGATGIGTATGLPTGVTAGWSSGTITISGTPTASGTFNYSIPLSGGCGTVNATGTITVTPANTITLSSASGTDSQTKCINTAITDITYATTGATGATFSGLPTGVIGSWNDNVVTISGTPTEAGNNNYMVTLTGGCGNITATGSINVTANNTIALTSAAGTNAQTPCINTVITDITYATTGATGATFSGLPAGVNGNWSDNVVTISGTPTAAGDNSYTVTLTGGCGNIIATGSINVTPVNTITLTSAAGTNAQTPCINTAITDITYATTGATGATFSGLPDGVNGSWSGNVVTISGTPSVAGDNNYTVTLTGGCGTVNATGKITVNSTPTVAVTNPAAVCSPSTVDLTASAVTAGSTSGLTFTYWTDSGATNSMNNPSAVSASGTYYIKGTTSAGCFDIKPVTVVVNSTPTVAVTNPAAVCSPSTVDLTAGSVTSGSTSGLTFTYWTDSGATNSLNNPSAVSVSGTYYIKGTTSAGCFDIKPVTLTVNLLPTVFNVSGGGTYCAGGLEVAVDLSGSQSGVNYQLYKDGVLTGSPVAGTGSALSFSNLAAGTYTVQATLASGECPVQMNGNATVSIGDFENPVITNCQPGGSYACVSNVPEGVGSIAGFVAGVASVTDNCTAPGSLTVTFTDVISHDTGCKVTRTYTVKDEAGNQATCTQTFTINDTEVPVINSVTNIVITPNDNSCGANLTIDQPTAITEACSLINQRAYYQYTIGGTPHSGYGSFTALFPEGTTVITWTVTDLCGHVSAPKIQTVQVGFNMTEIAYDNGSTETGLGSGMKPMQTSTHEYFVDNKTAEVGYSYDWELYESNGTTTVTSSLYTLTKVDNNPTHIKITFTTIPTEDYILSVIKTKNEITCKKPKTLSVTVAENTFDTKLNQAGPQCQAGETGTPSTIIWLVTFPGDGVAPYSLNYTVSLIDESNNVTWPCSGSVSNITRTGITASLHHESQCGNTTQMPYMQVEKTEPNKYTVSLKYTINSVTAKNFKVSIDIHGSDQFTVTEIHPDNNSETLDAHGVPDTSAITTD